MKPVQYTSKLYLGYVIVLLAYYLLNSSYYLLTNPGLITLLPWAIQVTVLVLVVVRHKWVKYGIKGWSLFFIFGSGLQLFAQLLFLVSDTQEEMVGFDKLIRLLVTVLLGLILFVFADKSIISVAKEVPSNDNTDSR